MQYDIYNRFCGVVEALNHLALVWPLLHPKICKRYKYNGFMWDIRASQRKIF